MNITSRWGRSVRGAGMVLVAVTALSGVSCGVDALWFNTTTSLGRPTNADGTEDDTPGRRANLNLVFKNNTAYRAVFTYGTYDPLNADQDSDVAFPIKFNQFVIDPDDPERQLDAFSESEVITFGRTNNADPGGCGRALGIGHEDLIILVEDNEFDTTTDGQDLRSDALRPVCSSSDGTLRIETGIAFFSETSDGPSSDPDSNACETVDEIAGYAQGVVALQGVDYPCGGTLVLEFVQDGVWPDGKARIVVQLAEVILP